jgi:hypothetical protein
MGATTTTPGRWIRDWLDMLDRRHPGWSKDYDRADFETALEDVFGREAEVSFAPAELEILGEWTAESLPSGLEDDPAFGRSMIEFEYIFRRAHGSSGADAALREMRARTLGKLVEATAGPLARRLGGLGRAIGMREVRRAKRRAGAPDGLPDRKGEGPEAVVLGREAAWRTALRAEREFTPESREALRRFFVDPGPAREAAAEAGISPATKSRALQRLRAIAAEELRGCGDEVLPAFTRALFELLGAK